MLIQELKDQILPQYGGQILSAQAGALTKACAQDLKTVCTKYQNANAVGKLSQIQHHIDGVKNVIQDNIKTMLAHTERVESIAVKAEELGLQAKLFRKQGKLNRALWWKNCKFKLMLIFIAVVILTAGMMREPNGGSAASTAAKRPAASHAPTARGREPTAASRAAIARLSHDRNAACKLCRREFTFITRRHHCRTCG